MTTCCFDKTGTLTSDVMELEGVAGVGGASGTTGSSSGSSVDGSSVQRDVRALPLTVNRVLACCQSLVQVEAGLVGDPVERAAIEATGARRAEGWRRGGCCCVLLCAVLCPSVVWLGAGAGTASAPATAPLWVDALARILVWAGAGAAER